MKRCFEVIKCHIFYLLLFILHVNRDFFFTYFNVNHDFLLQFISTTIHFYFPFSFFSSLFSQACPMCSETFTDAAALVTHFETSHSSDGRGGGIRSGVGPGTGTGTGGGRGGGRGGGGGGGKASSDCSIS